MTGIINLNRARKQKARAEKRRQGDLNAAKHGRTKAERMQAETEALRTARALDQHRREGRDPQGTQPDPEGRDGD